MRKNVGKKRGLRKNTRSRLKLPRIEKKGKIITISSNAPIKSMMKSQSLPCLAGAINSPAPESEDPFHGEQDIHQYCQAANTRVIHTMKSCILASGWGARLRKRIRDRKAKSGTYNPANMRATLAEITKVFENAKSRREMISKEQPTRPRVRKEERIKEITKKQEKKKEVQVIAQRVNEHEERVFARIAYLKAYPDEAAKLKNSVREIFASRRRDMLRSHDDVIQRNIENGANWLEVREKKQMEIFETRHIRRERVRQKVMQAQLALCNFQDLEYKERMEEQGKRRSELMLLVEREKAKMQRQMAKSFQKPWLVIIALESRLTSWISLVKLLPLLAQQNREPGISWGKLSTWWKKKWVQRKRVDRIYRRNTLALHQLQAAQKSKETVASEVILDFLTKILPDPWIKFRLVLEMRRFQERAKAIQKWWRYVYRLRMIQVSKLSAFWDKQEKKILELSLRKMNKLAKQGKSGEVLELNASIRKRGALSTLIAAGHIHIHNKVPPDVKRAAILKLMNEMRKVHKKTYREYLRTLDATAEKRRIHFRIEQAKREFLGRPPLTNDDEVIGKPKPPVFNYMIKPKAMRAVIIETGKQLALRRMTEMMTPVKKPKYAEFDDVEESPVSTADEVQFKEEMLQQPKELITPVKGIEVKADILTL